MRIIVALALVLFIMSLLSCASGSGREETGRCAIAVHLRSQPEGEWSC